MCAVLAAEIVAWRCRPLDRSVCELPPRDCVGGEAFCGELVQFLPSSSDTYEEIWSRNWPALAMGLLGVVFDGTSELSSDMVQRMLDRTDGNHRYWRFQTELRDCNPALDDASPQHAAKLFSLAETLVAEQRDELQLVAGALTQ